MAWKTKDVDDAYTESWWIFVLFCVQLEIVVVAAPLITILRGVSTNGRLIGYTILYWVLPVTALSLIMVPKYIAYWRAEHGLSTSGLKRGERSHMQIYGVDRPGNTTLNTGSTEPAQHSYESGAVPSSSECDASTAAGGHVCDS
jgi:hypothetical protein